MQVGLVSECLDPEARKPLLQLDDPLLQAELEPAVGREIKDEVAKIQPLWQGGESPDVVHLVDLALGRVLLAAVGDHCIQEKEVTARICDDSRDLVRIPKLLQKR